MKTYDFKSIESKWQKIWVEERVFEPEKHSKKPKYYCLEMFPYPSGWGIHMGHARNYVIGDVISRFRRMRGFNVLHPIGWDAFGLPAENAAIKHGIHPKEWTEKNIIYMKHQLKKLGISYSWEREINTSSPEYYRWNQWIFLKMFEKGLSYKKKSWVNWCPRCETVLANEQVINGKCWRCESDVEMKELSQWFLKITDYAEELYLGHELLEDWLEKVLTMQKNWIGRSKGSLVDFPVKDSNEKITVFTTRLDTIYGATFLVLSPEHPFVDKIIKENASNEIYGWCERIIREIKSKKPYEEIEKEGVFSGKMAINPFSREEIPVWIANYVLMEYGTGAIMAVPAHDRRDFEFAKKYSLKIKKVIKADGSDEDAIEEADERMGILINSEEFSGMDSNSAINTMNEYLKEKKLGKEQITHKIRDWGISRQRYWGTPIPIIYCERCGIVPVKYEDLPVLLPEDISFSQKGGSPLEKSEKFINTECYKCGGKARRETDTMDTFFDSSWYYLRYISPEEKEYLFNISEVDYWMPVDMYIGGIEHAILHLIYSRFFTKVLRDLNLLKIHEPFPKLLSQGMVTLGGFAMSKSRGNVVAPDEIIDRYGADTLRSYILFSSPPDKDMEWSGKALEGCYRFLNKAWRLVIENIEIFSEKEEFSYEEMEESGKKIIRETHKTIKYITENLEKRLHFNTAVSKLMEFLNSLMDEEENLRDSASGRHSLRFAIRNLILLLSPFAPHVSEEMWEASGEKKCLCFTSWPSYEERFTVEKLITVVVQVNGKVRGRMEVNQGLSEKDIRNEVEKNARIMNFLDGKKIKKIVWIPDRIINYVTE
ncbi:MAG: leucine--tRNA ligase [Acidobacteriota bacterium]